MVQIHSGALPSPRIPVPGYDRLFVTTGRRVQLKLQDLLVLRFAIESKHNAPM
jgi:hypothetical protein